MTYNLFTEPWILAVDHHYALVRISLFEALTNARAYRALHDTCALTPVALLRLLLAVLVDALRPTVPNIIETWRRDSLPTDILSAYAEANRESFNLFGSVPFWQVRGLPRKTRRHWTQLFGTKAKRNTAILYDHAKPDDPPPSFAEALSALVTHQSFTLVSGNTSFGMSFNGPLATRLVVHLEGRTLHDTFCLNLLRLVGRERGAPIWRRDLTVEGCRARPYATDTGLLARYTPQSRAVRLYHRAGTVPHVQYATGERPVPQHNSYDPMLLYRAKKNEVYSITFKVLEPTWRYLSYFGAPATLNNPLPFSGDPETTLVITGQAADNAKPLSIKQIRLSQAELCLLKQAGWRTWLNAAERSWYEIEKFLEEHKVRKDWRAAHNAFWRALDEHFTNRGGSVPPLSSIDKAYDKGFNAIKLRLEKR